MLPPISFLWVFPRGLIRVTSCWEPSPCGPTSSNWTDGSPGSRYLLEACYNYEFASPTPKMISIRCNGWNSDKDFLLGWTCSGSPELPPRPIRALPCKIQSQQIWSPSVSEQGPCPPPSPRHLITLACLQQVLLEPCSPINMVTTLHGPFWELGMSHMWCALCEKCTGFWKLQTKNVK